MLFQSGLLSLVQPPLKLRRPTSSDPFDSEFREGKHSRLRRLRFLVDELTLERAQRRSSTKKLHRIRDGVFLLLVTPQGFEPRTSASVVRCSIQLSYGAVLRGQR